MADSTTGQVFKTCQAFLLLSGLCGTSGTWAHTTRPVIGPLANNGGATLVHMLKLGSPAIDGVVGSDAPSTDQRGLPRPQGAGFDIGAVKRQPKDSDLAPRLYLPLIVR